jgi:hypothetical protein
MGERTITGIGMPAIEECPECESDRLHGSTITVNSSVIDLDGSGRVARWHEDMVQDTLIMSLDCAECGVALIEDAEVVHEEVDA